MRNLRTVTDTPPRAVIYLRQSIAKDDSISIEMQETACRDYCERMGYVVVDALDDPGISGRIWSKRPKVQLVMNAIEAGEADVIVLWKWSRLSRSRKDWALAADRVDVAGGRIESATEPIDTATASGRFARGVMTEYAAFQSEQIGEVWEEVRQRRLKLGMPVSGRLPFGWRWLPGGGIEPDPDRAPLVVEMYRRYLAGAGSAEVARWLNREGVKTALGSNWTGSRPFTVMDSPIHVGLIPYRGQTYPGAHAGIIDEETWQAYLRERQTRSVRGTKPRAGDYILSQLVVCSCGARMHGKGAVTGGKLYRGYMCGARRTMPEHPAKAYVSALALEPKIEKWMLEFDIESAAGEAPAVAAESKRERLHRQQSRLEDEAAAIVRDRSRGDAPASVYDRALAGVTEELRMVEVELRDLAHAQRGRPDARTIYAMRKDWEFWPADEQNKGLRRLIARVELSADGRRVTVVPTWPEDSSVIAL